MAKRLLDRLLALLILAGMAALVVAVWFATAPAPAPKPGEGDEWGEREAARRSGVAAEAAVIDRPDSPEALAREYAAELDGFRLRMRFEGK